MGGPTRRLSLSSLYFVLTFPQQALERAVTWLLGLTMGGGLSVVSLTSQACLRTLDIADWFNLVCSSMHSDQIYAGKLQVRPGQVGSRQLCLSHLSGR